MSILTRVLSAVRKAAGALAPVGSGRGGWFPLVREPFTGAWQRNQELSQDELLGSPMVYACTTRISNDIGKLRARLVEIDDQGIWKEVEQSPSTGRCYASRIATRTTSSLSSGGSCPSYARATPTA